MVTSDKPRLIFFRYKVSRHLPEFLLIHRQEHLKCLSTFFHVTVIDEDCDYDEVCDKHRPDLALFEVGLNLVNSRRLSILRTNTHAGLPKVALVNADAWCETRSGMLSETDKWGIEVLFSISTTVTEHLPEMADNLFTWPPFIDTDVYHDYGEQKLIPIVLTGSQDPQYPWRRGVYKRLSDNYPSLLCPHGGYLKRSPKSQVMYGERYARTLNASLLVPACGTVAKEAVRKHFEIPGCRACLITEASNTLRAAGFVDMQNCVFADESDVLDKVEYLFSNPAQLMKITDAGYELARSRHSLGHRNQILQWYRLKQELRGNQRIVQSNPFGSLTVSDSSSDCRTPMVTPNGLHLGLIRDGDEALAAGNLDKARQLYQKALNYMPRLPEAKFKLGLCSLYQGDANKAAAWIWEPLEYSLAEYKAADPDPIEWAYYIVSLVCQGRLPAARGCAAEFSWLRHPELDRVRWTVEVLANKQVGGIPNGASEARYRASIHRLPERDIQEWISELCKMLEACGQNKFVAYVRSAAANEARLQYHRGYSQVSSSGLSTHTTKRDHKRPPQNSTIKPLRRHIDVRVPGHKVRRKLVNCVLAALHAIERRVGAFLPYRVSERRRGHFCKTVETMLQREHIRTVLILGAAPKSRMAEAVLQGDLASQDEVTVVCVGETIEIRKFGSESSPANTRAITYPSVISLKEQPQNLASILAAILSDNGRNHFEALLIDGSTLPQENLISELPKGIFNSAVLVMLTDINISKTCTVYQELLENDGYSLVDYDLESPSAYAIFRRKQSEVRLDQKQELCCPASGD